MKNKKVLAVAAVALVFFPHTANAISADQAFAGYFCPEAETFRIMVQFLRETITKTELIDAIAKSSKLSKVNSEKAFTAIIDAVINTLKKVRLVGFGTFESVSRKARTGRNPQTGKEINITASKVPKFRAGAGFKQAVNSRC